MTTSNDVPDRRTSPLGPLLALAALGTLGAPETAGARSYTFVDVFQDQIGPARTSRAAGDADAAISDDRSVLFYRMNDDANGVRERQLLLDRTGTTSLLAGTGADGNEVIGQPLPGAAISDDGNFVLLPLANAGGRLVRIDRSGVQVDILPPGGAVGIERNANRDALGLGPRTLYDTTGATCTGGSPTTGIFSGGDGTCSIRNDGTAAFRTALGGRDVNTGRLKFFSALAYGNGGAITLWSIGEVSFDADTEYFGAFADDGARRAAIRIDTAFPADNGGVDVLVGSDISVGPSQTTQGPAGGFAAFDEIELARNLPLGRFVIGTRDSLRGVFSSLSPFAPATVDSAGPFADFSSLSVNADGDLVFRATFDGGGAGIFTGADPFTDKVVQIGDVIDGRTVLDLGLRKGDAINADGDIVFDAVLSGEEDPYRVIIAAPSAQDFFVVDKFAQLSTLDSFDVDLLSDPLLAPEGAFDVGFTLEWLSGDGALEVFFGDLALGRFGPDAAGRILIEDILKTSDTPASLRFALSGTQGTTVTIDDVVLPGLVNGDFETGYLDFWRREGDTGIVIANATLAPVPLPGAAWLLLAGLGALALLRRHRLRAA